MASSRKKRPPYTAFAVASLLILFILMVWIGLKNPPGENLSPVEEAQNVTLENHKYTGLKEFTNPPENITSIKSMSWWKKGTRVVGGVEYGTLYSEIRLKIYEVNGSADKAYVLNLQPEKGLELEREYPLKGILIDRYTIKLGEGMKYIEVSQVANYVYVLSFQGDSFDEAELIWESVL